MTFEQVLLTLETNLLVTSDPAVLSDFYEPVQYALRFISLALYSLAIDYEDRERSEETENIIEVVEELLTKSLQTISLWTECAEKSIRAGNLAKWKHSATLKMENYRVMKNVDEIMRTINRIQSEYLVVHKQNVTSVIDTICLFMPTTKNNVEAKVRRESVNSLSSMDVLIAFGFKYQCKVMTFVKKTSEEFIQVWCELVKKEDWKRLEEKRLQENPNLQKLKDSQDIFMGERQRVRVDVKGNFSVGQDVPKNSLLITFFPESEDSHIFLPLCKKSGMHGVPYTTITYSMDSGKKICLHTLSFDPWTLRRVKKTNPDSTGMPQPATINMASSSSKINVDNTKDQSSTRVAETFSAGHAERSTQGNDDKPKPGDKSSTSVTRVVESASDNDGNLSYGNDSRSKSVATTNISSPDPDPDRHRAQVAVSNTTKGNHSRGNDKRFSLESVATTNISSPDPDPDRHRAQAAVAYRTKGNEGNHSRGNDKRFSSESVATTNISSSDSAPDQHRAQAAVSNRTKEYYQFEELLNDFVIEFIGEKCKEHGIDELETFLMLGREDLMKTIGLNLGSSLKFMKAQQKFNELER